MVHGLLAALTDIFVCKLSSKVLNDAYVKPAVCVQLAFVFVNAETDAVAPIFCSIFFR